LSGLAERRKPTQQRGAGQGSPQAARQVYVGNLPPSATETTLSCQFSEHGKVLDVRLMMDRLTGLSLGYAFVEMATPADAKRVIAELDCKAYDDREITVRAATPNRT